MKESDFLKVLDEQLIFEIQNLRRERDRAISMAMIWKDELVKVNKAAARLSRKLDVVLKREKELRLKYEPECTDSHAVLTKINNLGLSQHAEDFKFAHTVDFKSTLNDSF